MIPPFVPSSSSGGGGRHDTMQVQLKMGTADMGNFWIEGYEIAVHRGQHPQAFWRNS